MRSTHKCRFCCGTRENDGEVCLGCGSQLKNCLDKEPKRPRRECPGCTHGGPHREIEPGRYRCLKCTAVFEGADVGFLDDRPDVNVEKLERMELDRKKSRGRGANRR